MEESKEIDKNIFNIVKERMLNIVRNDIEYMNENEGVNYCYDCFIRMNKKEIEKMVNDIIDDGFEDEEDPEELNHYIIHNLIYDCEDVKWLEYDCKCDLVNDN